MESLSWHDISNRQRWYTVSISISWWRTSTDSTSIWQLTEPPLATQASGSENWWKQRADSLSISSWYLAVSQQLPLYHYLEADKEPSADATSASDSWAKAFDSQHEHLTDDRETFARNMHI
jgi:hypothetical protein